MLLTPPNLPMNDQKSFPWLGLLCIVSIAGLSLYVYSQSKTPVIQPGINNRREEDKTN